MRHMRFESIKFDKEKVGKILANTPGVLAAYLFGSVASNTQKTDSDIDIALVYDGKAKPEFLLELQSSFVQAGFDKIDVCIISNEDLFLRFEAVKKNIVIYSKVGFDTHSYYSLSLRQYFDFMPYLTTQQKYLKERILNGQ
jgi:uncharacterized protein